MKHETIFAASGNRTGKRPQAAADTQRAGKLRRVDGANARPKRNKKRQTAGRTGPDAANDFLKQAFLPRAMKDEATGYTDGVDQLEKAFFASLSRTAEALGVTANRFPDCNDSLTQMCLALSDFRMQLSSKLDDWRSIRLLFDKGKAFFAKEVALSTGCMLYYIPVLPVYRLLRDEARPGASQLILSVCCYLYHVADIPYHGQEGNYINSMYQTIREWAEEDGSEPDPDMLHELDREDEIGREIERLISDRSQLQEFKIRIKNFAPADAFDLECLKIAKEAFRLYEQFPDRRIYDKLRSRQRCADYDDDESFVELDQYVSFYTSDEGIVAENLLDIVNSDLQEIGSIDEPVMYEPFDGRPIAGNNFDFETALFPLMEDLAYLLIHYKAQCNAGHNESFQQAVSS